jgi:hypothetical protein
MRINKANIANKPIPKKNKSNNFASIKKIPNTVTAINTNSVIINDFNFFIFKFLIFSKDKIFIFNANTFLLFC